MIMEPELVKAVGGVLASVLVAWQARTANKVRDLEKRLAAVEDERDDLKCKLRAAAHHIREWLGWRLQHAPDVAPPALPPELADEV